MTETLSMGLPESYFWESTPRKIIALIDQKNETEKIRMKNQAIYIASFVWGKDPDELQKVDKAVAGRDVPIDPNAIKCLFM